MKCWLGSLLITPTISILFYYADAQIVALGEELFMNIEKAPLKIPSYVSAEAGSLLKSVKNNVSFMRN